MAGPVPVVVCTGKDLPARLAGVARAVLEHADVHRSLVILTTPGACFELEQARVVHAAAPSSLHAPACPCCAGDGAVARALRDAFMQALRRQIPVFGQVVIELDDRASLNALTNLLRYDAFLSQRYVLLAPGQDAGLPRIAPRLFA
jgi:hypothetical protein